MNVERWALNVARFSSITLATLLTLLTLFTSTRAHAANQFPPGKMTFQGFLTDASNPPVPLGNTTPANTTVVFKIYKSPTSTAAADVLWAESQVVTVDKGHFSVLLGEGSVFGPFAHPTDLSGVFTGADASDRWIGLTVDGSEITPRIQFFGAPYAHLARAATSLVGPTGQTTLNLANGRLDGTAELTLNPGPLTVTGNATVSGSATLGSATVTGTTSLRGNVGIGTTAIPGAFLEFGAGASGKDGAAGKIGYGTFSAGNSLDIVGAGSFPNRKIKLWDSVEVATATMGTATVSGNATLGSATVTGAATLGSTTMASATVSGTFQVGPFPPTGTPLYAYLNGLRMSGGDSVNTIWQSTAEANLVIAVNSTANTKYVGLGATSNPGMVVTGAGNVGIGKNEPGATLDVNGDANISGRITSPKWKVTQVLNGFVNFPKDAAGYISLRDPDSPNPPAFLGTPKLPPGEFKTKGTFTSSGGTLVIFVSASAWIDGGSAERRFQVLFNSTRVGELFHFHNSSGVHHSYAPKTIIKNGISAGTHTIEINNAVRDLNRSRDWHGPDVDVNDTIQVIVTEYPF